MVRRRLFPLAGAALVVAVALLIRTVADGPLVQYSGTALYASLIYAGVFVLRPGTHPVPAGAGAVLFCWIVEFFQLTGVPAEFPAAHLVLGAHFDGADLAWYPVGVVPLVVAHLAVLAHPAVLARLAVVARLAVRVRRGSGVGRG